MSAKHTGRPLCIPIEDLAVAYEMRAEGVAWKFIGRYLGHDPEAMKSAIYRIERVGIHHGTEGHDHAA